MRRWKRGLALILALAMICGAAAMAETMDEFCDAYNAFLPVCFGSLGMDEETASSLIDLLTVSYDEGATQSIEFPTYRTEQGQFMITFGVEDDPYAGFSLYVEGQKDETLSVPLIAFLAFFSIQLDALSTDEIDELVSWLFASDVDSGKDFNGYSVSYMREEDYIIVTFDRQ